MTAARIAALLGPLSVTPAHPKPPPRAEPEPAPPEPAVGDTELIGERVRMTLIELTPDGRAKWCLTDEWDPGRGVLEMWFGREKALERAAVLIEKLPAYRPISGGSE